MRRVLVSLTSAALVVAGAFALASRPEPTAFGPVKLVPPIYAGTQPGIDYVVRRSGWSAGFGPKGLALSLPQGDGTAVGVAWRLAGAAQATPVPQDLLPTLVTEYDGVHERVGLPSWSAVRWPRPVAEADLVLRSRERDLEWSVEFERGADRRRLAVEVEGVDGARLEGQELRLRVGRGELVESGLACRQAEPVACRYTGVEQVREGLWRYEIEADGLDPAQGLVVDPGLTWSVTISGDATDAVRATAPFDDQSFVVVGSTRSSFMPGAGARGPAGIDGYILRISGGSAQPAAGLGALYIAGITAGTAGADDNNRQDGIHDAFQLVPGRLLITGQTTTQNLQTTGPVLDGSRVHDAFVSEVTLSGGALSKTRFTYLGSTQAAGYKIARGPAESIVVGGQRFRPGQDFEPVVWGLSSTLAVQWVHALNPLKTETIKGIAASGDVVHILGTGTAARVTESTGLAGLQPLRPGTGSAGWILGLNVAGATTSGGGTEVYFSWLGGDLGTTTASALLVRGQSIYVAGHTTASNLCSIVPSQSGMTARDSDFQAIGTDTEGFVLEMTAGSTWNKEWRREWCTFLGAGMNERIYGLGWNPRSNHLLVAGALTPVGAPTGFPGVVDPAVFGKDEAFATELTVTGAKQQAWSRLFGGTDRDFGMAITTTRVPDASYPLVLVGNTAGEFHTAGTTLGYDAGVNTANGTSNLFVVGADLTPPVVRDDAVQDGVEKSDLDEFRGPAKAKWAAFDDPEDPTVIYEVGFASGSYCTEAADLVMPFQKATGLTHTYQSADAGLVHGTMYYAVVRGSNTSGLSTLACSNGAVYDPLDGGVGLDARTPKPDTGRAEDTGTEPDPDTGVALDAGSSEASDAGRQDAALAASDAGDTDKQPVLGWGCSCGAAGGAMPLLGVLLALGLRRRRW